MSERSSSLPPLRPRSREEVVAAVVVGPYGAKRPPKMLDGGANGKFWQRPPRLAAGGIGAGSGTGAPSRTEELFRGLEARDLNVGPGFGSIFRSHSGDGRSASPSTSTPNDSVTIPSIPTARSTASLPSAHPPKPKRRLSHLRAIKAMYAGVDIDEGRSEKMELSRVLDVALDTAHGLVTSGAAEARRAMQELAQVRTGEDAIKFFTRYGGDGGAAGDVRVLYCNRPQARVDPGLEPRGTDASFYDLVVVSKEQVKAEYFTISASGVVHFQPGQLSECIPLAEWLHQSLMFRVLSSMNFFRLYPHRKSFLHWRTNARHVSFCRQRQRLASRCFLAKPLFVGPVMQARCAIAAAGEIEILKLSDHCSSLADFAEMQRDALLDPVRGVGRELETKQEELCALMEQLVASVGKVGEQPRVPSWERSMAVGAKGKPMLQERKEAQELSRRLKMAKDDEIRVGSCIHLVAYMLQAELVAMMHRAAEELRHRIESTGAECNRKFLLVHAILVKGSRGADIELDTPSSAFQHAFRTVWQDAIACADSLPTLTSLSPRLQAAVGYFGGPVCTVEAILAQDRAWQQRVVAISAAIDAQVLETVAFARHELSGPCGRLICFGEEWDEASYLAKAHTVSDLAEDVERVQKLREALEKCRVQKVVGSVFLDARSLRDSLAHVPEEALEAMKHALVALGQQCCTEACRRLEKATRTVAERPEDDAGYYAFARAYAAVVEEQTSLEGLADEVRQAYELLARMGVRISLDDRIQLEGMHHKDRHLTDRALLEARLFLDRQRPRPQLPSVTVIVETCLEEAEFSMSARILGPDLVESKA
mmetsp:Transcript_84077/g.236253  ORF Transcript_84077/g.236253 Transcript_84077/m.236253 type:complete len:823 (-) Transcript_84077:107-2575(-)